MKFKVGDKITGMDSTPYSVTTKDAVMEVIESKQGEQMRVKILEHEKFKEDKGNCFNVNPKYFKKISIETTNNDPVYWECKINSHSKFWAARIIEKRVGEYILVRKWGRIGNQSQMIEQVYNNRHKADVALKKLIWEKQQKGYKPIF